MDCNLGGYNRQGEEFLSENNKAFLGDSYKNEFIKIFTRR
jgi:hypothetical protein